MIGNDIIDLKYARLNSRWKEQRFLDKLFTKEEQENILSDENRFEKIWRLWSMKESVYKITSRSNRQIRFNPKDFKCSISSLSEGLVIYNDESFPTVTERSQNFIATTSFLTSEWISEVYHISDTQFKMQREESYQYILHAYACRKSIPLHTLKIIKNGNGIPQFSYRGKLQKEHLTLSHHGNFGAFAFTA